MMSAIPGFGDEERYEEPMPPHEDEAEHTDGAHPDLPAEANANDSNDTPKESNGAHVVSTSEMPSTASTQPTELEEGLLDDDDESDDEGFVVTIGQVKQNAPFASAAKVAAGGGVGKLDVDATPTINGQPIYDLDLAAMEDRPWRKPGADITDYFNYGFCEETWNTYCERQRKLRSEYGTQAAINKAIFSSISLINPISQPNIMPGGRQLQTIPIVGQDKTSMDLSNFKSSAVQLEQQPVIRTVLSVGQPPRTITTGGTSGTSVSTNLQNVSIEPPADGSPAVSSATPAATVTPDFSKPPPVPVVEPAGSAVKTVSAIPTIGAVPVSIPTSCGDGPPGVDEPAPPGSSTPPTGFADMTPRQIPTLGATVDTSVPPPAFNPLLPPPAMTAPPPAIRLGLPNTNVPPPGFSVPPPSFGQPPPGFPPARFGAPGIAPLGRPPPLMSRPAFPPPGMETRRESRDAEERDRDRDRGRDRDRERERDRDRDRDREHDRDRDRDRGDSGESDAEEYSSRRRHGRRRSRSYSPRSSSRRHRDDRDRDSDRYREKSDRDRDRDRESRSSRRHRSRSGSAYESSRSSRRKEERGDKEKEKKKGRDKEEGGEEKEREKKDRDREHEGSERGDRERDKDKEKDKDRKKRRHKSDDEKADKREKDREKKKSKPEEEQPSQ